MRKVRVRFRVSIEFSVKNFKVTKEGFEKTKVENSGVKKVKVWKLRIKNFRDKNQELKNWVIKLIFDLIF